MALLAARACGHPSPTPPPAARLLVSHYVHAVATLVEATGGPAPEFFAEAPPPWVPEPPPPPHVGVAGAGATACLPHAVAGSASPWACILPTLHRQ